MRTLFILLSSVIALSIVSCLKPTTNLNLAQKLNDSIKHIYAPDKRVAVYDIDLIENQGLIELQGETDQLEAIHSLLSILSSKGINHKNNTVLLPDNSVGKTKLAVINNSVANIRSKPKHSGELATQGLLGTALKVLKINGDFYLVQTPDGYISWVDHGGVILMDDGDYSKWFKAPKIIYSKTFGHVYQDVDNSHQKVSDIVLGSQLIFLNEETNHYKVAYPDNRIGYVKKSEATLLTTWLDELQPSGNLIELYASELLGIPYLWGGTSTKGMDCSGFTKTVYLMNGFIIPRDASQQIHAGKNTDPYLNFENMEKGDLVFFGKKASDSTKQRVTHVGIWLGNGKQEFIHASGRVKIGSVNSQSPYFDEFNTNRYLGSRRYLGVKDKMIQDLKTSSAVNKIKT